MSLVDEGVVIGELDERPRPAALDGLDFGNHPIDGLDFVDGRDANGRSTAFAAEWATTLRLHGDSVVAINVQEVEARDLGVGESVVRAAGIVDRLEGAGSKIGDEGGPHGFSFSDDDGIRVAHGFERESAAM